MSVQFKRLVRWILRKCGYLLIPFDELFDMERTGRESYRAMKKQQTDKDYGYFNGIADHASKTALLWRQKYLSPNAQYMSGARRMYEAALELEKENAELKSQLTLTQFQNALVRYGVIDAAAIDYPDAYDGQRTLRSVADAFDELMSEKEPT
jgi:hypothetical protein